MAVLRTAISAEGAQGSLTPVLSWSDYVTQGDTIMDTPQLTFDTGQTAILMADFHREGMGDNPMVRERGTVQKAQAVLEAARQAGVLVVYIVVNFRPGYPEISDRNVIFRERKNSGRVPPTDPVSLIIPEVQPLPNEPVVVKHRFRGHFGDMPLWNIE